LGGSFHLESFGECVETIVKIVTDLCGLEYFIGRIKKRTKEVVFEVTVECAKLVHLECFMIKFRRGWEVDR